MPRTIPHPDSLFEPSRRHLFVFAHQDDELPYAGIVQRANAGKPARALWITNGDGLAEDAGVPLADYAAARRRESEEAARVLGLGDDALRFLGYSEVAIYDRFVDMARRGAAGVADAAPFFLRIAADVERAVRAASPDVVWTLAYQGGHPEHDLTHLATYRALRRMAAETGRTSSLFELPAYELTVLVPLRFKPWLGGVQHAIELTPEELDRKLEAGQVYPSQVAILDQFRKVIGGLDRIRHPFGRGDEAVRAYLGRETFRPVPPGTDHTRSPHALDALNYPLERHRGVPVAWKKALLPLARLFSER